MELRVKRAPRIDIEITVPGDKSISHRAVIVAALSNGLCTLHGFLPSDDCMHTVNAMRALGIKIEQPEPTTLIVHGKKRVLNAPKEEINCGNSGTTMRLLAGLLAGQTFESRLVGDAGLSRRPMDRVIAPRCEMGASVVAQRPGDISSAAFWLVAAAAQRRGHLLVRDVGLNDTRTALLAVLLRMGAQVREAVEDVDQLEPRGIVEVTGLPLKGTVIQGKEVPQLIDELPILSVAGALANGKTIVRQAQELRVKETDRIAAIAHNLRTMGAHVAELSDGLEIPGPAPLHGARVASFGDHRIAMAFAIAGLFADGETIVQYAECIRESYPGFEAVLEEFTNPKRMQVSTPVIGSLSPTPPEAT